MYPTTDITRTPRAEMKIRLRSSRRWSPMDMRASGLSLRLDRLILGSLGTGASLTGFRTARNN